MFVAFGAVSCVLCCCIYVDVVFFFFFFVCCFFFFNDTATTEIYTLSLHDALPICGHRGGRADAGGDREDRAAGRAAHGGAAVGPAELFGADLDVRDERDGDRKSTRLNSSH